MNILVKSAVGAALALGAVSANALGIPSLDNSDLVLVIQSDSTPGNVYVLDTGISLNSAMAGTLVTNATLNTSLAGINQTISASPTLSAFLASNPLSGDGWAIEGGQYSGGTAVANPTNAATKNPGKAFGVFSSGNTPGNIAGIQLSNMQQYFGGLQGDLTQPADSLGLKPLASCGALCDASTGASYTAQAASKYTIFSNSIDDRAQGAGSVALYGVTGNGGTGVVQSYILGSVALDATGKLTFTGNSSTTPVPIPAAVWLFGSGLMGLVGVSRRRKTATVAV